MTLTRSPDEIAQAFALEPDTLAGLNGKPLRPRFNVAPTQQILTVVGEGTHGRAFAWKKWGLVPSWAKDPSIGNRLINARADTVAEKPSFRSAFKARRCLIVADGFYEWGGTPKRPHWFRPRDGAFLAMAGLHEHWLPKEGDPIDSATIITTDASTDVEALHNRMPVLLGRESWARWLDPKTTVDELRALLVPAPTGTLEDRVVSTRVNSPKNDDPKCIEAEPLSADEF